MLTPSEQRSETRGMLALGGLMLLACGVWYFAWVRPHDEFMLATLECTKGDASEAAWTRCAAEVRARQ